MAPRVVKRGSCFTTWLWSGICLQNEQQSCRLWHCSFLHSDQQGDMASSLVSLDRIVVRVPCSSSAVRGLARGAASLHNESCLSGCMRRMSDSYLARCLCLHCESRLHSQGSEHASLVRFPTFCCKASSRCSGCDRARSVRRPAIAVGREKSGMLQSSAG